MTLRQAITRVQEIGERHNFTIAVVGGAFVRNISKGVKIQSINAKDKVIYLSHTLNPGVSREEDPTTIVDIDAIAFSKTSNPFLDTTKKDFQALLDELQNLKTLHKNFPAISLEPVFYHPVWKKPNTLFQFVSSVEQFPTHPTHFFFRLGSVQQSVKSTSLEVWTYVFSDTGEHMQSLLPQALQLRYMIRGFSIKPKDKEKIWGEKSPFARFVRDFQNQTQGKYDSLFTEWNEFAEKLQHGHQPTIKIKRTLWNLYWSTIGTYLAHGTGFLGKILLPLGNTFFAGK